MAKPEIDLNKFQISDEVKEQIKTLAEKYNTTYKASDKKKFDDEGFDTLYFAFGMSNLTLMHMYYTNNMDLYILSCIFLSKRLMVKYYYMTQEPTSRFQSWNKVLKILMVFLSLWF